MTDQRIEVERSEDGFYRWRLYEDAMWTGGCLTRAQAESDARAALKGKIIRRPVATLKP